MSDIDFTDMLNRNNELVQQFNADVNGITIKYTDAIQQYLPALEEHCKQSETKDFFDEKWDPIIKPYFTELWNLLRKYKLFT